jgi:hypothetical protein
MKTDRILAVGEGGAGLLGDPDWPWTVLYGIGWLFVIVGLVDIALLWYPFRFGVPEYEFASTGSMLDALPLFTMGLAFLLAGAAARGNASVVRLVVVIAGIMAVIVIAAVGLYALTVPLALKSVSAPQLKLGIEKSIAKVAVQAFAYPVTYIAIVLKGRRLLARTRSK